MQDAWLDGWQARQFWFISSKFEMYLKRKPWSNPVFPLASVLVRLLLPRAPGRHSEDAGAEPGGHVHVRAEHDGGGAEAALLAPDHAQPRALLPQRRPLHGPGVLLGGPTGLFV